MVKVTATVKVNPEALKARIERAVDPAVRQGVMNCGQEMVRVANALMAADFNLDRPYERRRHPGSRRAKTALDFTVVKTQRGYQLGYRVLGGDVVFKRILGMNFGTPAHTIVPSGKWPLGGRGSSSVQRTRFGGAGRRSGTGIPVLAWTDADEGVSVVTHDVAHPGTRPSGFLEEARDNIVARAGSFF